MSLFFLSNRQIMGLMAEFMGTCLSFFFLFCEYMRTIISPSLRSIQFFSLPGFHPGPFLNLALSSQLEKGMKLRFWQRSTDFSGLADPRTVPVGLNKGNSKASFWLNRMKISVLISTPMPYPGSRRDLIQSGPGRKRSPMSGQKLF